MDRRLSALVGIWRRLEWRAAAAMREDDLGRVRARLMVAAAALVVIIAVTVVLSPSARVASWAPLDVIESTEPLQELPIRVVGRRGSGAATKLDLGGISHLVIGVDLDLFEKTAEHYDTIIKTEAGDVVFRDRIPDAYFDDGRFLLRITSRRFRSGTYRLEIVDVDEEPVLVAMSTFDVRK